ncbi:MAG TPA: discoidin domain-containing protein, partial [bacterium]|nr:discoidin domain-containing protein [bacterium]
KTAEQILENLEYKNDIVVKIENLKSGAAYEYELILMNEKNVELIDSGIIKTLDNNIALNKKVEGTFDINPEPNVIANSPSIISRITDGKIHYFTGMATSGNVKEAQQNVIIDLEEEQFIEKIKVYWRAIAYSKNYYVMISSDKKKWNYIGKNIDASKGITMRSESGDPLFVNEIAANNKARYIRIWLAKNSEFYCKFDNWNFVQIFEIEAINNQI